MSAKEGFFRLKSWLDSQLEEEDFSKMQKSPCLYATEKDAYRYAIEYWEDTYVDYECADVLDERYEHPEDIEECYRAMLWEIQERFEEEVKFREHSHFYSKKEDVYEKILEQIKKERALAKGKSV